MAKVLVIDDDGAVRELLSELLGQLGHEATLASDGFEGLSALEKGAFDLVVTDLVMPNKEGLETIREMRALDPELKILAISGGGLDCGLTYLRIAKSMGASHTLPKPFTFLQFKDAVGPLLDPAAGEP